MNGWAYRKTIPQNQMYIIYIGVNLNNAVIALFAMKKNFSRGFLKFNYE